MYPKTHLPYSFDLELDSLQVPERIRCRVNAIVKDPFGLNAAVVEPDAPFSVIYNGVSQLLTKFALSAAWAGGDIIDPKPWPFPVILLIPIGGKDPLKSPDALLRLLKGSIGLDRNRFSNY